MEACRRSQPSHTLPLHFIKITYLNLFYIATKQYACPSTTTYIATKSVYQNTKFTQVSHVYRNFVCVVFMCAADNTQPQKSLGLVVLYLASTPINSSLYMSNTETKSESTSVSLSDVTSFAVTVSVCVLLGSCRYRL